MKKNTIMKRKSNDNKLANSRTSNMIIGEEKTNVKLSTDKEEDMEFKENKDQKMFLLMNLLKFLRIYKHSIIK